MPTSISKMDVFWYEILIQILYCFIPLIICVFFVMTTKWWIINDDEEEEKDEGKGYSYFTVKGVPPFKCDKCNYSTSTR